MLKSMNRIKNERRALKGTPGRHLLFTSDDVPGQQAGTNLTHYYEYHATKGWRRRSNRNALILEMVKAQFGGPHRFVLSPA